MSLFYQGWFAKIVEVKIDKINDKEVILGKGGNGIVYRGKMLIENLNNSKERREVPIAIKRIIIRSQLDKQQQIEYIKRELSVYEQIKSKNIVQLYGSEQKNNYYDLYLEKCDGNLLDCIYDENGDAPLKEEEALRYFKKIFDTLQLLKNSKYERSGNIWMRSLYHRDINVKNILYKKSLAGNCIKLCDFGQSQYQFDSDHSNENRCITMQVGTPYSMSPENMQLQKYDLEKNETWSLGILLFCLLFGYQLLQKNLNKFASNSNEDHLNWINQLTTSIDVKQLLFGLLQKDPQKRMNYQQIRDSKCYKLLENTSQKKTTCIPESQFEYLTQAFYNMDQNLLKQIPQDLIFTVFQNYKNWVYKQCDNYSGYYKKIDVEDLFQSTSKNSINYNIIPITLSKQYSFFQNILLEKETQNEDIIISFWRKITQSNKRCIYQKNQKYYFLNLLYEIDDKLQLEQTRLDEQTLILTTKLEQQNENKKQEKLNKKLEKIGQLEKQNKVCLYQLQSLIRELTLYFECKRQKPYDSQLKQSQKYN